MLKHERNVVALTHSHVGGQQYLQSRSGALSKSYNMMCDMQRLDQGRAKGQHS